MLQDPLFLGLDFGTSGARVCVIDNNKNVARILRVPYPDISRQTPQDWRFALHSLLSSLPKDIAAQLQGIAINGTSGTVLLCDEMLEPCSPVLLYNDNRAMQQAAQLKAIVPSDNTVCNAASGLAKFLWLTQQSDAGHAVYFLHQADWLTALLSGQAGVSDYHNTLKTGYDVENLCWPDWVTALPHAHLLPDVLAPGAIIGNIQPGIAEHFGINPQCAIHAGTTDSTAAFIASEVNEAGIGVTSLGTTLVLKQLSTRRIEAPKYGVYSHRYGDLWLAGGASNAGAGILRQYFSDSRLAALSMQIDPLQDSPLDYYPLDKPGERFPVNNAQLAPRLDPRPDSDVDFLHGLLQGLARIEAAGYSKLAELGVPPLKRVLSNGGGAKNEVWRTMRERLIGVPVGTAACSEAAYGSALLCMGGCFTVRNKASN
jgi:sugar (pentulose or hexulose) kinase